MTHASLHSQVCVIFFLHSLSAWSREPSDTGKGLAEGRLLSVAALSTLKNKTQQNKQTAQASLLEDERAQRRQRPSRLSRPDWGPHTWVSSNSPSQLSAAPSANPQNREEIHGCYSKQLSWGQFVFQTR